MVYRIVTLIIKELQALLRDRQGRLLLVMPVLLQLAVFPFASTLEVKNNTLAILNQDTGKESVELIQRLSRAEAFTQMIYVHSDAELRQVIERQKALLVLRLGPDFSRGLSGNSPVVL